MGYWVLIQTLVVPSYGSWLGLNPPGYRGLSSSMIFCRGVPVPIQGISPASSLPVLEAAVYRGSLWALFPYFSYVSVCTALVLLFVPELLAPARRLGTASLRCTSTAEQIRGGFDVAGLVAGGRARPSLSNTRTLVLCPAQFGGLAGCPVCADGPNIFLLILSISAATWILNRSWLVKPGSGAKTGATEAG
ncbi:hypothetical protein LWI28_018831 [Acer negundo]|uniref:Uncharacterized protein n=1 Tax=Acer negundo TaxID=4023 RepID=A0AAD5J533_ACENE|nr:hypothetical protein LWI28_018831 [Acer negundo]